jgi:hypothetical protein
MSDKKTRKLKFHCEAKVRAGKQKKRTAKHLTCTKDSTAMTFKPFSVTSDKGYDPETRKEGIRVQLKMDCVLT